MCLSIDDVQLKKLVALDIDEGTDDRPLENALKGLKYLEELELSWLPSSPLAL